ncbi:tyrosine-type recombinase/integrase [Halorubrum californiense]|uniref:tyrosine-type recombinase/integrase n=1 Tax=Halorubrum californiense TaxID=416585 RepID=UPI0009B5BAF8|nr:site-specific integrase [Halorubrum californiense]
MNKDIEEIASAQFGTEADPLLELQPQTEAIERELGEPIFDYYEREILGNRRLKETTKDHYRRAYRDWQEWMSVNSTRHPTLPSVKNVKDWIQYLCRSMNEGVALDKVNYVKKVYEWLQGKPAFKHPTHYNPFIIAKNEYELRESEPDDYPKLVLEDIIEQVKSIKHIGERAATVFQLKTGVRSTELSNIRLEELHLSNADVRAHFDGRDGQRHEAMGSHDQLEDYANAVYIPPDDGAEHAGNKRKMPTVIPLDGETQRVLVDWLLIRPDNGDPHVFFTQKGKPLGRNSLRHVWTKHWHPQYQYGVEDEFRSISPHYARHWFTTWFRVTANMPELWVQYLRGDRTGHEHGSGRAAIHRYIHTYYEDVEDAYVESVFKLGI